MMLFESWSGVLYGTTCVVLGFLVVVAAISAMLWSRRQILRERILLIRRERDQLRAEVRALTAPPVVGPFRTAEDLAEDDLDEDEPVEAVAPPTREQLWAQLASRGTPGFSDLFRYVSERVTAALELKPTEDELHAILRRARLQKRRLIAERDALLPRG